MRACARPAFMSSDSDSIIDINSQHPVYPNGYIYEISSRHCKKYALGQVEEEGHHFRGSVSWDRVAFLQLFVLLGLGIPLWTLAANRRLVNKPSTPGNIASQSLSNGGILRHSNQISEHVDEKGKR